MKTFRNLILTILFITASFTGCNDEGENPFLLTIVGNGGNFTGYYQLLNEGDLKTREFSGELSGQSLYLFEEEIDEIDKIDVYATRLDVTTALSIKLYRYDKEVASEYRGADNAGDTTVEMSLRLSYETTSSDTSSDSNSDSD